MVDGPEGKVRCVKVEKDIRGLLKPHAEKAIPHDPMSCAQSSFSHYSY